MADHSFITLYAHIGRRIHTALSRGGRWVRHMLFNLFVLVLSIGFFAGLFLPLIGAAHMCAT
jgi:hypothetical protein